MKSPHVRVGVLAGALLVLTASVALSAGTVTITPVNPQGWTPFQEGTPGSVGWSSANAAPGYGTGSIRFATTSSTQAPILFNASNFDGIRFDTLTELSYWGYRTSGTTAFQHVSLQVNVDYNLTDTSAAWQGRLVFEPYYTAGVTSNGTWYQWNALAGKWWATGAPGNTKCTQALPCTMAQVLGHFPNAGIQTDPFGAMLFKAGSGWPSFEGYVDALTVGVSGDSTTYNFEVDGDGDGIPDTAPPTSKDQCKKNGWQSFNNPTFKNQGDCVSFVTTGGSNGPNG